VSVLIRLAQVLKVTVEDLIGQPLSLAPNGGIEFRAIPALRAALTDYEVIPATFGVATDDGPTRDLPSLRRNVDQANRLYQAAHYEEAGLLCSQLIGEVQRVAHELTGNDRRGAFSVLAETYHITAKTLTKVGETELAWIAAERSLPAAQSAELPLLMAASAYHLGHVFLRAGQVEEATGVAMTATRALEPGLAIATPEHLSAWGALHLTALIAVARQDDRAAVRQLLGEAWTTADRLGQERNDFWTAFGPTNVALHEVSTAVELGDPGEVVRKGEALDPAQFPPGLLGRRAQVFIDLARGYTQHRKDAGAEHAPRGRPARARGGQISGDRQGDAARAAEARTSGNYASATPAGCPSRHPSRGRLLAPLGGGGAARPQGALRAIDPCGTAACLADLRSAPPSPAIPTCPGGHPGWYGMTKAAGTAGRSEVVWLVVVRPSGSLLSHGDTSGSRRRLRS
jgi:hypothetical protein